MGVFYSEQQSRSDMVSSWPVVNGFSEIFQFQS